MGVEGRVAVVTGSGRGIGRGIVERLARGGARVVVNDVDSSTCEETVEALRASGAEAIGVVADVSEEAGADDLIRRALEAFARVDVLVNNVEIVRDNLLVNMTAEEWDLVLKVNLKSYFLTTRAVARSSMKEQAYGRIVNIASRAWLGNVGQANYSASKGGIVSLTRTLALELGRYGITVNCVAPGLIDTPLTRSLREDARERLIKAQPLGIIGTPADIAHAVHFFVSDESGYITGQVLHVCGGKSVKSDW